MDNHTNITSIIYKEEMLCLANISKADVIGVRCSITLHLGKDERHLWHIPRFPPSIH